MNKTQILKELSKLQKIVKESGKDQSLSFRQKVEVPFEVGREYFFRTVTFHVTGRVKDIVGKFLVLEDAAWIADSGRFHLFFEKPDNNLEVEPFGKRDVFVNTEAITDAAEREVLTEAK